MATSILDVTSTATETNSTPNVNVEERIYRSYGFVSTDAEGNAKYKAYGEKSADGVSKVFEKPLYRQATADGKAWATAEADGNLKLSENKYQFYTLQTEAGFSELVPDAEQRLYILNKGLGALQTQKSNQMQAELADSGEFKYSDATIDLRDAINESPKREKLTEYQRTLRDLGGLSATDQAALMAALQSMLAAQQSA